MFKGLRSRAATECGELQLAEGECGRLGKASTGRSPFHRAWSDPHCPAGMRPRRAEGSGDGPQPHWPLRLWALGKSKLRMVWFGTTWENGQRQGKILISQQIWRGANLCVEIMFSIIMAIILKFRYWWMCLSVAVCSGFFATLSIANIVGSVKQLAKIQIFKRDLMGFTYLSGLGALHSFQS